MSGTDGLNGKGEGWIEWSGGIMPVGPDVLVDTKWGEGGFELGNPASTWIWSNGGRPDFGSIIAYRTHKEP